MESGARRKKYRKKRRGRARQGFPSIQKGMSVSMKRYLENLEIKPPQNQQTNENQKGKTNKWRDQVGCTGLGRFSDSTRPKNPWQKKTQIILRQIGKKGGTMISAVISGVDALLRKIENKLRGERRPPPQTTTCKTAVCYNGGRNFLIPPIVDKLNI